MLPRPAKIRHGFDRNPYGSVRKNKASEFRDSSSKNVARREAAVVIDLTLDSDDEEAPKSKLVASRSEAFKRPLDETGIKRELGDVASTSKFMTAQSGATKRPHANTAPVLSSGDHAPKAKPPVSRPEAFKRARYSVDKSKDDVDDSAIIVDSPVVGGIAKNTIDKGDKSVDRSRESKSSHDLIAIDAVKEHRTDKDNKGKKGFREDTPTRDPVNVNAVATEEGSILKRRRLNQDPAGTSNIINTKGVEPQPAADAGQNVRAIPNPKPADVENITTEKAPSGPPANSWGRTKWREIGTEIHIQPEVAKSTVETTVVPNQRISKPAGRDFAPVHTTVHNRHKHHIPFANDSDSDSDDEDIGAHSTPPSSASEQQTPKPVGVQRISGPTQQVQQSVQQDSPSTQEIHHSGQQQDRLLPTDDAKSAHVARCAGYAINEATHPATPSAGPTKVSEPDLQELAKARQLNHAVIATATQIPVDKPVKRNTTGACGATNQEKQRPTTIDIANASSMMAAVNAARRPTMDKPLKPNTSNTQTILRALPVVMSKRPKPGDAGPRPGSKLGGSILPVSKSHPQLEKEHVQRPFANPSGKSTKKSIGNSYLKNLQQQTKRQAIARAQGLAATRGEVNHAPDDSEVESSASHRAASILSKIQKKSHGTDAPRSLASMFNVPNMPDSASDNRCAAASRPPTSSIYRLAEKPDPKPKPSHGKHVTFSSVDTFMDSDTSSSSTAFQSSSHARSQTPASKYDMRDAVELGDSFTSRPTCGGKTISNASWEKFLAETNKLRYVYDNFQEPQVSSEPDVDDKPGPDREPSPFDEKVDTYHYVYSVWRKVWFDDDDEDDDRYAPWTICGDNGKGLFTSLQNANKHAGREATKKRDGIRPAGGNVTKWSFEKDNDGMTSYYFESENNDGKDSVPRITRVRVSVRRDIKTPEMRHRPTSKIGWLPKHGYTVYVTTKESRPVYATIPSLVKQGSGVCFEDPVAEDTDGLPLTLSPKHEDDGLDYLFSPPSSPRVGETEAEVAHVPEPQPQELCRVHNESTKPVKSHFTSLEHANYHASQTLLNKQFGPVILASARIDDILVTQDARQQLKQKLEELKESRGLFDYETDEPINHEGVEITYRVYVEEVELLGPRNI